MCRWLTDAILIVTNTYTRFPTHLQGNKLKCTIIINNVNLSYNTKIVDELTTDHYAIVTQIQLSTNANGALQMSKRLTFILKHRDEINCLQEWCDDFCTYETVSHIH